MAGQGKNSVKFGRHKRGPSPHTHGRVVQRKITNLLRHGGLPRSVSEAVALADSLSRRRAIVSTWWHSVRVRSA